MKHGCGPLGVPLGICHKPLSNDEKADFAKAMKLILKLKTLVILIS